MELLNLEAGDKLKITTKISDLNSGKTFVNNYISVYGIESPTGKKILDLESYNSCQRNSWKKFNVIGIILIIILSVKYVKKLRKE